MLFPILFLSSIVATSAWAASCEIKQTADRFGNQRILKIDFPDGRRITLVGQSHTDRNEMWRMLELPDNSELFKSVRESVNSPTTRTALPFFEEEKTFLQNAVMNEGAKFIGVEMTDTRVPVWMQKVRDFQDRMLVHSARTGESDIPLISKARLAAYGAPLAMPLEQPALFLKARLYGIEDGKTVARQWEAVNRLEHIVEEVSGEFGDDHDLRKKFKQMNLDLFGTDLIDNCEHYNPNIPGMGAVIINPTLSKWPGKYRKAIRKYLEGYVAVIGTLYARDEQSTKNILAQNESGIIFIGGAHAIPIMRRLKNSCLEMQQMREDMTSSISSQVTR